LSILQEDSMNRTLKGLALAAAAVFVLVLAVSALQTQAQDTAKDPVCGMSVKIATAKYTSDYKGTKYYFCSEGCKTSFDKDPEKYLDKKYVPKPDEQKPDGASCSCAACATKK